MNVRTIKRKYEDLKVVKNGTSLQVTIPASYIKETNLKPGDPITATFEARPMQLYEDAVITLKRITADLHKEIPAFRQYTANEVFQIILMKHNNTNMKVGEQLEQAIRTKGEIDETLQATIGAYNVLKKNEDKFNEILAKHMFKKEAQ